MRTENQSSRIVDQASTETRPGFRLQDIVAKSILQAEIPDSPRGKTVLDELLRDYKNKISIMRAIMRLPKSSIRDVAMNAILEAFTK